MQVLFLTACEDDKELKTLKGDKMRIKTNHNRIISGIFLTAGLLLSFTIAAKADNYRVLHHFASGANDGATPILCRLIQSGSFFYGVTFEGGSNNAGTIFKMNSDGAGFELMHSFVSPATDGQGPIDSLLQSGSTLYGMASCAGTSYNGTIFKINIDGSDFQVLHQFTGNEGKWPGNSLVQSGSTIYGMCTYGGSYDYGTIFKMNTDGTGFQLLKTFNGTNGGWPHDNLILSGAALYGMTEGGGSSGLGVIFRINTDGSSYSILHNFTGSSNDGAHPVMNTLILSGSTFYGATLGGGSSNKGTIFKMNTDGTGFALLHSFTGSDGQSQQNGLTLSGSMLYGITTAGGDSNLGTIFQMGTDGTGYQLLHSFNGSDGSTPYGSLFLSSSTLYGMTSAGGSSGKGVIYALDLEFSDCDEVKAAGFRLDADINGEGNCYVDTDDLATLVSYWLSSDCSEPDNCHGSDFSPVDGHVDFADFGRFAAQWLLCNDPQDTNCIQNL